jgi:SAM-dependent methyltransferase
MFDKTITAKIYNFGKKLVSSEYMPKDHVKEFISQIEPGQIAVELGSGNRRLRQDIFTMDLFPFPNVDIVADIIKTPFPDNSVDFIILDTVLEHVSDPFKVIAECHRIMKPGGKIVSITPFLIPYHGYPKHFYNFTEDGLHYLFRDFSDCKVEMNMGPTSALVNLISEYFGVAFSGQSKFMYTLFKGLALVPIFLFKYFDIFWARSKNAKRIAYHLCVLAVK